MVVVERTVNDEDDEIIEDIEIFLHWMLSFIFSMFSGRRLRLMTIYNDQYDQTIYIETSK